MPNVNVLTIVGHLGGDPELKYTQDSKAVCNFSVAVNVQRGGGVKATLWFKVAAWGKQGEACAKFLKKGSLVYVSGRLDVEEWTDRDNNNRTSLKVMANEVAFLGGYNTAEEAEQAPSGNVPGDDDIPF